MLAREADVGDVVDGPQLRRDANKAIDAAVADKKNAIPEDAAKSAKEEIDELTKKFCDGLDALAAKKCAEIEEI